MKIGLGITALCRGDSNDGVDGIGVYGNAVQRGLGSITDISVTKLSFGYAPSHGVDYACNTKVLPNFSMQAFASVLGVTRFTELQRLSGDLDLFHATDHRIPKLKGVPVIATVHDVIPFQHTEWQTWRFNRFIRPILRQSISWADFIVTISDYSAQQIFRVFKFPETRTRVIHHGVDTDWFAAGCEETHRSLRKKYDLTFPYFINYGTLQPRKNNGGVIDAYQKLPPSIQREVGIVFVGRAGSGSAPIVARIKELIKSGENVRWLQHIPKRDLQELVKGSLGLIFPSFSEGFGFPVLEGFASGVPVVASRCTSIPEITGGFATLIDPNSPEEISHCMRSIVLNDSSVIAQIPGAKAWASKFTWHRSIESLIDTYRRVI